MFCVAEDCLGLAAALAVNLPARVLDEVCTAPLLQPASALASAPRSLTPAPSCPRFVDQSVPGLQHLQQVA